MGAIAGEELVKRQTTDGAGNGREDKILVSVRLRPLSEKEIARNEVSDWECINETTILYRNSLQERSGLPAAYSFDRVFGGDCPTRKVYEDGAKDIALSVVTGINSTIFAYGQTSSGKTYTMNGITEFTVADIYDYIEKHEERAFVLKFAAVEIYNEVVRDLLSRDNAPLRILDDPERGTIIERLTEETLRDWGHLKKLLSICEAQRQIGETSLNETSSRSHQILRLTIESSAREFIGKSNSTTLAASVNFVDLAGSERASQALSVGQRLKEGCHINRSLLTLSTVIRKLSQGNHGHVNFRDSKLTRILQPSLGGNARTAIVCTLSPARTHVEQSRNTLLFASCAQEVTTNAQVNVVMSDKALVKQLQKEVARLESELRTPGPNSDYTAMLRKKDIYIEKLEKEVRELTKQRDLAQSRIDDLLKTAGNGQALRSLSLQERSIGEDECSVTGSSADEALCRKQSEKTLNHCQSRGASTSISKRNKLRISEDSLGSKEYVPGAGEESDTCKEVRCIEVDDSGMHRTLELLRSSENDGRISASASNIGNTTYDDRLPTPPRRAREVDNSYANGTPEERMYEMQKSIASRASPCPDEQFPSEFSTNMSGSRNLKWNNRGSRANIVVESSSSTSNTETTEQNETTPPSILEENLPGRPVSVRRRHWKIPLSTFGANFSKLSRNDSLSSNGSDIVDGHRLENVPGDEDILNVDSFVAGLKEMAKIQYGNQIDGQVQVSVPVAESPGKNVRHVGLDPMQDSLEWPQEFEKLQSSIIKLWQTCNVSFVHRTYFFMLFRGDRTDSIYLEVELRRLSFLGEAFSKGNTALQDGQTVTATSSLKALVREKHMLSRLINRRLTKDERNKIYDKWGIRLKSKQRRLQLVNRLWSKCDDMDHISESAAIIAQLIRFSGQGRGAVKEMFGLSFTPPHLVRRSLGYKHSKLSLS